MRARHAADMTDADKPSPPVDTQPFDPDGPATRGAGIFGLPHTAETAAVVVVPVPFEATVSYRQGTVYGPEAIFQASHQVDLLDADVGRPYQAGVFMETAPEWIRTRNSEAREAAERVIDAHLEDAEPDPNDLVDVDDAGAAVNHHVRARVEALLASGKLPVVVGGDHSVPFGSIVACAKAVSPRPLGVLHLDAHLDLRDAYEGFKWSHASIMKNVLDVADNVVLTQVGIRDFSDGELAWVEANPARTTVYFDAQLREVRLGGRFADLATAIAAALTDDVYFSFDIDGLDPALCPSTGTPVPGGFSYDEIVFLMGAVVAAGKRVVGMDLVEVAPPPPSTPDDLLVLGDSWDANVGARLLYKMIGFALRSRGQTEALRLPVSPLLKAALDG